MRGRGTFLFRIISCILGVLSLKSFLKGCQKRQQRVGVQAEYKAASRGWDGGWAWTGWTGGWDVLPKAICLQRERLHRRRQWAVESVCLWGWGGSSRCWTATDDRKGSGPEPSWRKKRLLGMWARSGWSGHACRWHPNKWSLLSPFREVF